MKKTFSIYVFIFISCSSFAQVNLDSLWTIWNDKTQTDTTRLEAMKIIVKPGYLFSRPDSAYYHADKIIKLAEEKNLLAYKVDGLNLQGLALIFQSKYHEGFQHLESSEKIAQAINYRAGLGECYNAMGGLYLQTNNFPRSIKQFQKGISIFQKIPDSLKMFRAKLNIARIYGNLDKREVAMNYYLEALPYMKSKGTSRDYGITLLEIGRSFNLDGKYLKAQEYFNNYLKICEISNDQNGKGWGLMDLGSTYSSLGEYDKAHEYFVQSAKFLKESKAVSDVALIKAKIGMNLNMNKKPSDAIKWCLEAANKGEDSNITTLKVTAYECLYLGYKELGKMDLALKFHELHLVYTDSLNLQETRDRLRQMEFEKEMIADSLIQEEEKLKIEMAHKEEVMKKDKFRNILFSSGLILLLLAAGFFSRWRYVKKSKDILSKEKDRSDNLLLNILPAEIAEELKLKGSADARDFEQVSILFTDFKEFTQMSEKLSAKDLVAEINHCFKAFDGICEKYGVEKIKTIGDSYMAAGGLPVPKEDSVKNTVLAALEMAAFIINRKAEREAAGQIPFEMRTGIHTGNVVAGIVGVKKFQYDVWGDTVNTASRIESNGKVGQVNISQSTYEILKNDSNFVFESRGKVQAKGKGEIEMYFVKRV